MKIAIWHTGHTISDTICKAVKQSCKDADLILAHPDNYMTRIQDYDLHIGYGILRGCGDVFRQAKSKNIPYINIDRGYFNPGHYDGYYRISLNGTQHTNGIKDWMLDDKRFKSLGIGLLTWRGFDKTKPSLICPPTQYVADFFDIRSWKHDGFDYVVREKGATWPIVWNEYSHVVTFNSSLGWEALRNGIPCKSSKLSFLGNFPVDTMEDLEDSSRMQIFNSMSNLQLSLNEIIQGDLWPLVKRLLHSSDGTVESKLQVMSQLTASIDTHTNQLQSII